jgi:hypothetical protein
MPACLPAAEEVARIIAKATWQDMAKHHNMALH